PHSEHKLCTSFLLPLGTLLLPLELAELTAALTSSTEINSLVPQTTTVCDKQLLTQANSSFNSPSKYSFQVCLTLLSSVKIVPSLSLMQQLSVTSLFCLEICFAILKMF